MVIVYLGVTVFSLTKLLIASLFLLRLGLTLCCTQGSPNRFLFVVCVVLDCTIVA